MRHVKVQSVFATLQGEGRLAGTAAIFVRYVGCNVWSGLHRDRDRDVSRGFCAKFCDTDFVNVDKENHGGVYSEAGLVDRIAHLAEEHDTELVVLTGGEPTLQVTAEFVDLLHNRSKMVAIETNGSAMPPRNIDWISLSPKPPMRVHQDLIANELKVLYPVVSHPDRYLHHLAAESFPGNAFVMPLDVFAPARMLEAEYGTQSKVHLPFVTDDGVAACVKYVQENPGWKVGVQAHKLWGLK